LEIAEFESVTDVRYCWGGIFKGRARYHAPGKHGDYPDIQRLKETRKEIGIK